MNYQADTMPAPALRVKATFEWLLLPLLFVNGILHTFEYNFKIFTSGRLLIVAIALVVTAWALYLKKDREIQIKALIGFSFLGHEVFLFIIPILFIPLWIKALVSVKSPITLRKLPLIVAFFLTYCLILIIVTNSIELTIINVALWFLISASWMLLFIYYTRQSYSRETASSLFKFLKTIILFQVVVMLVQAFLHRDFQPGDSWTGSSGNSVVIGFFFCMLLMFYFAPFVISVRKTSSTLSSIKVRYLVLLAVFAVIMYFNDSKMTIMAFVVAAVFYFVFVLAVRFFSKFTVLSFIRVSLASIMVLLMGVGIYFAVNWYGRIQYKTENGIYSVVYAYIEPRLSRSGANAKYILYKRVYSDLAKENLLAWTFGVGPGRFGGKASNIMAYDILYKEDGQVKLPKQIPPYSSYYTKRYMGDLWTKDIASTSMWRSATLSFPFAGMATIKGEYGFVGTLLFLFVVWSMSYFLLKKAWLIEDLRPSGASGEGAALRAWAVVLSICWFSLPFHMIFDNFQEKLYIIFPLTLLSAVVYSLNPKTEEN